MPSEIDFDFKVFFSKDLARPRLVDTHWLSVLEDDEWGWVGRCGRWDKCNTNEGRIERGAEWGRTSGGEDATPAEADRDQYNHADMEIGDGILCVLAVERGFYER